VVDITLKFGAGCPGRGAASTCPGRDKVDAVMMNSRIFTSVRDSTFPVVPAGNNIVGAPRVLWR